MDSECSNRCDAPAVPVIIGITGGIGSGKSVVSRILRLNGSHVYDCDSEARRLMEQDKNVIEGIIGILGIEAYVEQSENGSLRLDRSFVADKIFKDASFRDRVNGVVHKAVAEDFLRYARNFGGPVFCETAILATSHLDLICNQIWVVTAPEQERIERVKKRNGLPESEIKRRIDSQRDEFALLPAEKIKEIRNGSDDLLLPQIYAINKTDEICLKKF